MFGASTNAGWNASGFAQPAAKRASTSDINLAKPGGLFGSTSQGNGNNTSSTSGGLFGNSSTTAPTGGLFGNSSTTAASTNTGGLFGNSAKPLTGGLFGNSNTAQNTTAPSTGLFGNSSNTTNNATSTGGLFGNSSNNTNTTSGGLFGNSSNTANTNSGGLFGSSTQKPSGTSGLFGNSSNTQSSGLFGNSSNNQSSGLFGNSNTSNTGLFNNNQNTALPNLNADPYQSKMIFANINRDQNTLPKSLTEDLFTSSNIENSNQTKRKHSYLQKPKPIAKKSNLLSKIGQTLKIFRNPKSVSDFNPIKGLFTQSNYLNENKRNRIQPEVLEINNSSIFKPSKRALLNNNNSGSMKRLIIKSKPLKFHLINADKVFNSKRRRVVTNVLLSDQILSEKIHEENDDVEDIDEVEPRKKAKLSKNQSSNKTMVGESVNVDELIEETRESFDDGYWCSPPLKHLLQLPQDDLKSVENFIVGRDNFFQVAYDHRVDFTGIVKLAIENGTTVDKQLFGKSKVFNMSKHGQLEVYLNYATVKPALGFGLNVPATITLEQIKPSVDSNVQGLIRKLKSQTGQEFLTYDPIKYTWVFRVKHFSVWGLIDESNEELLAIKRKQDEQEDSKIMEYSKIYESEKYEQDLKKQKLQEFAKILPGGWGSDSSNPNLSLIARRDQVANEIEKHIKQGDFNSDEIMVDSDSESVKSLTPAAKEKEDFEYLHHMVNAIPRGTDYKELIDEKAYEPELDNTEQFDRIHYRPDLPVSKDWLVQLELANDVDSPLVPFHITAGPVMTLENIDDILFDDFNKESLAVNEASTPSKKDIVLSSGPEIYKNDISDILEDLIIKTEFGIRPNNYPKLQTVKSIFFSDITALSSNEEENNQLYLASALFDEGHESDFMDINDIGVIEHIKEITRKQVFGQWLRSYNNKIIQPYLDNSADIYETSFLQVCSGDIQGGVESLINTSEKQLSAILTLLDSNEDAVISIARKQLEDWEDQGKLNKIPQGIVKIYNLLARDFSQILNELPWIIGLGVRLFYGDNSLNLGELIQEKVEEADCDAVIDILKYYNERQNKAFNSDYINLKILWIFNIILNNHAKFNIDKVSETFGQYLTKNEFSKEASLVFSSISDDEKTKKLQRELIFKIDVIQTTYEDKILKSMLRIPQSLIFEAIAHKHAQVSEYWEQCQALLNAQVWDEAHVVIVQQLGPQAVLSGDEVVKRRLMELFDQFPEGGSIVPDWNKGAGIYKAYMNLNIENLEFILENLPFIKEKESLLPKTALKVISRKVGDLALQRIPGVAASKVLNLVLSESDLQYFKIRLQA